MASEDTKAQAAATLLGYVTEGALKEGSQYAFGMFAYEKQDDTPLAIYVGAPDLASYQRRVMNAHAVLFGDDPTDIPERTARFLEEALETAQAFGMAKADAAALVDYTFGRPIGEPSKEIGAALLTLASLCVVSDHDLQACGEADLEKLTCPETIERIRAKRATRHGRGSLPGFDPHTTQQSAPSPEVAQKSAELTEEQVAAVLHLVETRLCIVWPRIGAREEFANLLRVLEPLSDDGDGECCVACGEPLQAGDMVYYEHGEGGHIHAACCGPERESYCGEDGEPLAPGAPIPQPFAYERDAP